MEKKPEFIKYESLIVSLQSKATSSRPNDTTNIDEIWYGRSWYPRSTHCTLWNKKVLAYISCWLDVSSPSRFHFEISFSTQWFFLLRSSLFVLLEPRQRITTQLSGCKGKRPKLIFLVKLIQKYFSKLLNYRVICWVSFARYPSCFFLFSVDIAKDHKRQPIPWCL